MATNEGLRRAYTVWAIFYDVVVRFLRGSRRRSLALLDLRAGESLLIVGCGTGADFEFLPADVEVTAVDLTPAMLRRAAAKVGDRRIRLLDWTSSGTGPSRLLSSSAWRTPSSADM